MENIIIKLKKYHNNNDKIMMLCNLIVFYYMDMNLDKSNMKCITDLYDGINTINYKIGHYHKLLSCTKLENKSDNELLNIKSEFYNNNIKDIEKNISLSMIINNNKCIMKILLLFNDDVNTGSLNNYDKFLKKNKDNKK